MHRVADLLSPADMEALIRFLVITGIVLPLLPDSPIDPTFGVLRPRDVWRMVVLISGLSFAGYVLMRVRAGQTSYIVTGLLAGLVSSTAATLAYARAGRGVAHARHYESLIALASSTAFLRMGFMLWLIEPRARQARGAAARGDGDRRARARLHPPPAGAGRRPSGTSSRTR